MNITQVADLVGKLYQPGLAAGMGGMFDLKSFSFLLIQAFIVGDFQHYPCYFLTEHFFQFPGAGLRVFDSIVEYGRAQDLDIRHACLIDKDIRKGDGVVDVG